MHNVKIAKSGIAKRMNRSWWGAYIVICNIYILIK
jgi:hypothetical protein